MVNSREYKFGRKVEPLTNDLIPQENFRLARGICDPVSVTIAVEYKSRFCHHAMGLLIAIADAHFLVTCRHAVNDVVSKGGGLWVCDDTSFTAKPLTATFLFAKDTRYDIAIMKLPEEFLPYFSLHKFARAVDTHSSIQPEGISCVMSGVLATESETWDCNVTHEDERLQYSAFIGRTTTVETTSDSIIDGLHFLVSADNLQTTLGDSKNEAARLVKGPASFRGLSGTPVFAVNENPFEPGWYPHDFKIIGIQSAVVDLYQEKRKVFRVMRIETVFHAIREAFPTVGETLDKLNPVHILRRRL